MKQLFLALATIIFLQTFGQSAKIAIIPEPVSIVAKPGGFTLPHNVIIDANTQVKSSSDLLIQKLTHTAGLHVSVKQSAPAAAIKLTLNKTKDRRLGAEGYTLSSTSKGVAVKANTPAGVFYGVQTLLQLLPKEIETDSAVKDITWKIPSVEITDYPRFGWRGLMMDVSRHFFTKKEVMQFIDDMVKYKFNLLHMHLSDDEGWRIEIKGLPKLTEVGAWNVKKVGYFGTFSPPVPNEPRNYGGFFTQQDIKDIVQYAKARFVNVLPEIDMPGHSLAAIASYPELSCTEGADKYVVRSGEPIMDWSRGAPPIALVDNTLCPANEKVYEFVDKVITQLAELFPFDYIHVGGDEVPQNFWSKNDQIKDLMKKEGLRDMHAVQGYFMRRVEQIVQSKGKKMIGWDEILEAGVDKSAAIMSWRGTKYGIEAAKAGHEVVMSPSTYAYLDYMQGDPVIEPRVYASLRLNKTYEFDPLPEGVNPTYIKGGQANLWSEQIYNMRILQYMLWPRGFAIAESVWSPKEKKDWNHFVDKVENHFQRLDVSETKYSTALYEPIFNVKRTDDNQLQIELSTEAPAVDIYYSFDNHFPDRFYPKYAVPLMAPKDAVMLRVVTYKGKEQVGRFVSMPIEELQKRAGMKK